jgi:hypothetical protein
VFSAEFSGGNSLKRFGQSIKRIVREVEEQNTGNNDNFFCVGKPIGKMPNAL